MGRAGNLLLGPALAMTLLSGCVAVQRRPPLRIPFEDLKANYTTLCLEPVQLPPSIIDIDAKQAELERLVTAQLRTAEIAVVPAEQTRAAWDRVSRSQGGAFDPHSGKLDEAKAAQIRRATMNELGCRGKLSSSVHAVTASWINGVAVWDGMSDSLEGGDKAYGRVGALSLWVSIRDTEGEEIYFSTGGIQVTAKLRGFFTQEFFEVDTTELLNDTERNGDAVAAALEDLGGEPLQARRERRFAERRSGVKQMRDMMVPH